MRIGDLQSMGVEKRLALAEPLVGFVRRRGTIAPY
jgi:hypothetical protein